MCKKQCINLKKYDLFCKKSYFSFGDATSLEDEPIVS